MLNLKAIAGNIVLTLSFWVMSIPVYSQDKTLLVQADSLHKQGLELVSNGEYQEAIVCFINAAEIRGEILGKEDLEYLRSLNNIGVCYDYLEEYDKAIDYLEQARSIRERIVGKEHPDYLQSLKNIGRHCVRIEDYSTAIDYYKQVLSIQDVTEGRENADYASTLRIIGDSYYNLEDYSASLEQYKNALTINEGLYGKDDVRCASLINDIADCYYYLDNLDAALDYFKQSLKIYEETYGQNHQECLRSLDNVGFCYKELGNYTDAIEHYKRALKIDEQLFVEDDPDHLSRLFLIARCYYALGNYTEALDYLTLYEKTYGKEDIDLVDCLNDIGACYYNLGSYAESSVFYQRALAIYNGTDCAKDSGYATSLRGIGNYYYVMGDYVQSLNFHKLALDSYEKVEGKEHPDYAIVLGDIGDCYYRLAFFVSAIDYYQQARDIYEKNFGRDGFDCIDCLERIGNCYAELGDYASAMDNYRQVLTLREKVLGREHPDYATVLYNIGLCYNDIGYYIESTEYLRQALLLQEKTLGKDHPEYADCLSALGMSYCDLGDYTKALDNIKKALAITEKDFGREHPDYANKLQNIGVCLHDMEDYKAAIDYLKQALDIYEIVFGKNHPGYTIVLKDLGSCYAGLGDNNKALEYFQLALSINETLVGKNHPEYAKCLTNLGCCYENLGELNTALEYFQQAFALYEIFYGKNHPEYANGLKNLGECYYLMGDVANATYYYTSYSNAVSSYVTSAFSSLTEPKRTLFWDKYGMFFTSQLYSISTSIHTSQMNCAAYDGALLGKGLLLNAETEMRKLILESEDEEALRMYNEVQESKIKLDKFYEDPVGKKTAIDSLNNDIETRQQELMKRSKVLGDYTRNLALKWSDVQSALGKKDIAIEFQTYTHQDTTFYIALTLRPGYTEPHLVALFNSEDLKGIRARYDKDTGMRDYYSSTSLTKLIWGRLSSELTGVKNVYFSPAGELNNIGIEYLLDEDGVHLVSEKRNYYRLTSTRELVKESKSSKMASATVYGGIRYDITPDTRLTGEESESERLASAATRSWLPMGELSRARWEYLPGTKEEADAISSTLFSRKVHNDLIEGEASTEESFKALSGAKNDVIHIATHGFYWTETEATAGDVETSSFALDGQHNAPKEDKALTRSGLLFAGAQNTFEGKEIPIDVEDGILTAKDISRMDLRGTELAVLSACQSGLGEVTGDGVFGLQRGFKKAGVKSLVMSLWKVSDEATKIMMTRFYENLARGRSKYDSFREAQNYLRKYDDGIFDEPQYYAAFVLLDAIR